MQTLRYNGFRNWDTWLCFLWLDDGGEVFDQIMRKATSLIGIRPEGNQTRVLADYIESLVTNDMPDLDGYWFSIVDGSLSRIDWFEVAKEFLEIAAEVPRGERQAANETLVLAESTKSMPDLLKTSEKPGEVATAPHVEESYLKIFRTKFGEWAGDIFRNNIPTDGFAGFESPGALLDAVILWPGYEPIALVHIVQPDRQTFDTEASTSAGGQS